MVLSSSSSSRLSKRGRSLVSCVVDGCFSVLSKCKEYHRKHKVCEVHSKTVMVLVGGREQRFCQQCSRFHLLVEFDEVKRSCRKRLAGHNRRRRKPQLNSLNPASFMTNHQGARPTQFPITIPKSTCAPAIKEEKAPFFTYFNRSPPHLINDHNYQHFPVSSHGISKQVKQFPFLPENINIDKTPIASMRRSLLNSSSKIYDDSHRALSLLSSPVGKPLFPAVSKVVAPTGFLYSGMEQDIKSFQTHGLFLVGSEGSSDGSSHHTFYPSLPSWCSN